MDAVRADEAVGPRGEGVVREDGSHALLAAFDVHATFAEMDGVGGDCGENRGEEFGAVGEHDGYFAVGGQHAFENLPGGIAECAGGGDIGARHKFFEETEVFEDAAGVWPDGDGCADFFQLFGALVHDWLDAAGGSGVEAGGGGEAADTAANDEEGFHWVGL